MEIATTTTCMPSPRAVLCNHHHARCLMIPSSTRRWTRRWTSSNSNFHSCNAEFLPVAIDRQQLSVAAIQVATTTTHGPHTPTMQAACPRCFQTPTPSSNSALPRWNFNLLLQPPLALACPTDNWPTGRPQQSPCRARPRAQPTAEAADDGRAPRSYAKGASWRAALPVAGSLLVCVCGTAHV
jgi:hypothetical protein